MALNRDMWTEPVRETLRRHSPETMPLKRLGNCDAGDAEGLQAAGAVQLFPEARAPEAALSGLLLLAGCWEQSHGVSQNIETREGSYWHAIAHRMEPDSANATYWYRQVGHHAIFPDLHARTGAVLERLSVRGWHLGSAWNPYLFLEWCDQARGKPGTKEEQAALEIQSAEWKLLFGWCAAKRSA